MWDIRPILYGVTVMVTGGVFRYYWLPLVDLHLLL
jgi:hypothetical protein